MKVLIIDDDEAMIGIWSTVLKKDNLEVLTAGSGKLGIELATKNIPDFILLDQIITDMKGNDVLKQLKSNPTTAQIPVALVSNYSEPEMMHEAIESGATDYILKYQIDPSDLANKIKTLLHGTKSLNPSASQGSPNGDSGQAPATPGAPDPNVTAAQPTMTEPAPAPAAAQPQIVDPSASSGQVPSAAPQPIMVDPAATVAPQPVVVDPNAPAPQTPAPAAPQPIMVDPSTSSGQDPTKSTQ